MEFPPKQFQVTLLLTGKEKLPKYQEIHIISAGGKKTLSLVNVTLKTKNETRLGTVDFLERKGCSKSFYHTEWQIFVLLVPLRSATFSD